MDSIRVTNKAQKGQLKKSIFLPLITLLSLSLIDPFISKAQNLIDKQPSSNLEEHLKIINNTLTSYPAQNNNTNYTEVNRISINSKGKLTLYKQYQVSSSCTASREEVFLTDLEPTNISSYAKGSTMVITVGCKYNVGSCVQRFFRNSCDVTFKPESFQKELLVISSANLRNTEEVRNAFSQLIKIANNQSPKQLQDEQGSISNKSNNNSINENISNSPFSLNTPSVFLSPTEKKKHVSLTMEDVEPAKKKKDRKAQEKKSEPAKQTPEPNLKKENENLEIDKLLDLFLRTE